MKGSAGTSLTPPSEKGLQHVVDWMEYNKFCHGCCGHCCCIIGGNLVSTQFPPTSTSPRREGFVRGVAVSVAHAAWRRGRGATIGIGHWQPCDVAPLTSSSSSRIGRRRRQNGAGSSSSSRGAQPEVATGRNSSSWVRVRWRSGGSFSTHGDTGRKQPTLHTGNIWPFGLTRRLCLQKIFKNLRLILS